MGVKRNYFIISRSFGHFFKASIIIAVAEQLCQIVDMILVGNLISAEAFSALDLAIPLETAITGLMLLMVGGAGAIACRLIGDQEFEMANRVQTICVLTSVALAALISLLGLEFLPQLVGLLSNEPVLDEYLSQYLRVYFIGLVPMALYFSFSQIVDIDGSPMVVARAVVVACVIDVVFDLVFMKYFGWGVAGEALANIASYLYPVIRFVPYIRYKRCKYNFCLRRGGNWKLFRDNVLQGIPYCLPYMVTFLFGFVVNMIVMERYGSSGVYIWGVAYQILMVGFMMMDYCGKTILVTLGSMLYGCYDMDGIEVLVRKILVAATGVVLILIVVVWIFPSGVISMFGDSPLSVAGSPSSYVRIAVLFLIPYTYCCIKVYLFQILERRIEASIQMFILIGFTILSLSIVCWEGPLQLAYVLIASCALYYFTDIAYSLVARKLHPELSRTFLIPHKNIHKLYLSVPYSREGMNEALPQIEDFLTGCNVPDSLRFGINLCCEELILGLVTHNQDKDSGFFFDFLIYQEEGAVKVRAQDVGDPFNPIKHFTKTAAEAYLAGEEMHLSLQIINKICQQLKYNYLYEQNTIYMSFKI